MISLYCSLGVDFFVLFFVVESFGCFVHVAFFVVLFVILFDDIFLFYCCSYLLLWLLSLFGSLFFFCLCASLTIKYLMSTCKQFRVHACTNAHIHTRPHAHSCKDDVLFICSHKLFRKSIACPRLQTTLRYAWILESYNSWLLF